MKEIEVRSQKELDNVSVDFNGRIIIKFGTPYNRAVINKKYLFSVVAWGNSFVEARGNSSVVAWGNSSVEAQENSSVVARGNSSVEAWGNSSVVAWGNSSVEAQENSSVVAWENSSVVAWGNSSVAAWGNSSVVAQENSSVVAWENSSVVAWENSSVVARGNSSVVARGNSSVEAQENSSVESQENSSVVARGNSSVVAWGNSSVVAWGNSSVEAQENSSVESQENSSVVAWGNSQITNFQDNEKKLTLNNNARIVYYPRTLEEYISFYGLKTSDKTVTLYKAVLKSEDEGNTKYISSYDPEFEYHIGKLAKADDINTDVNEDCGNGIHCAYLNWCLNYGSSWKQLAILEVRANKNEIVFPVDYAGKVRAPKVKVIREVPLEECGLYGKMLAARRKKAKEG